MIEATTGTSVKGSSDLLDKFLEDAQPTFDWSRIVRVMNFEN